MANDMTTRQHNRSMVTGAEPYMTLRDAMDRLFQDAFLSPRGMFTQGMYDSMGGQGLDMYETENDLIVKVALPGVKPENVNLQVQGDQLTIDANMPEQKQENATYHYRGMTSGEYHHQITLPEPIDVNKIEATFENGVITIRMQKSEQAKPKKIQIKAAGK